MLVLLFDTVEPYVYETIPILFYPNGFIYEARFKKRHIENSVLSKLASSTPKAASFHGMSILICLRAISPKKDPDNIKPFRINNHLDHPNIIPMRMAEVVSISEVADFVLIRYRLGQFFDPEIIGGTLSDETACRALNAELYGTAELNYKGQLFHLFEFSKLNAAVNIYDLDNLDIDQSSAGIRAQSLHWRAVVSKFLYVPFLHEYPFLFFVGLRQIGGKRRRKLRDDQTGSLLLSSNTTYEFKVLEAYPSELNDLSSLSPEEKDVLLKESPSRQYSIGLDDNFFTKSFKQRAIGGYDFLEFSAPMRPGTHGNTGVIRFMLDSWSDNGRSPSVNLISDQLALEYRVRFGSRIAFLVGGVFFLAGAAILSGVQEEWASSISVAYGRSEAALHLAFEFLSATIYATGMAGVVAFLVGNAK